MKPIRLTLAQIFCRYLPPLASQRLRNQIYPERKAFADDYEFTVRAQTGSYLCHRTSDVHAYRFSVHGYFEWRNLAIALAVCVPGDTIIEIGGNIGTETIGFADIVGRNGKVFVFEPLPVNVAHLEKNLTLNNLTNVILLPYAVSDRNGKMIFVQPQDKSLSGCGHLLGAQEESSEHTIEVEAVKLDSCQETIGRAQVIFMDVEGAEYSVLQGAQGYLNTFQPYLVLEASPKLLRRMGHTLSDLYAAMENLGYSVYKIDRFGLTPPEITDKVSACNWLALPPGNEDSKNRIGRFLRLCGLLPCLPGINPMTRRN